jgi:hypothetical protein
MIKNLLALAFPESFTPVVVFLLLIFLIGFSILYRYYWNTKSSSKSKEKKRPNKSKKKKATKDAKESQEVYLIILIEEDNSTGYWGEEFSQDYEEYFKEDFVMDEVHYPFKDVDLNIRPINGFDPRRPNKNWSIGKVYISPQNKEITSEGEIVWVWVQIHLYYPMPMPTQFFLQCRLSEDFSPNELSTGDFVLLEYDEKRDEENFKNRTFSIIKIEKI